MRRYFRPITLLCLGIGLLLNLFIGYGQPFKTTGAATCPIAVVNTSHKLKGTAQTALHPTQPEVSNVSFAQSEFDYTLEVATDIATLFLFHPDDLAHRRDDPLDWWIYDFAINKEFAEGRLIEVSGWGDGRYVIRLTNAGLTEQERQHVVDSQTFRLQVRHGQLYIDGGSALPNGGDRLPGEQYESSLPVEYNPAQSAILSMEFQLVLGGISNSRPSSIKVSR
ncbi:MAG: DUF6386 family protein [Oculatellaceae cyanobacterium bins.114]|nr:DUF6386 family protein [Oculatellaceae cyanobacterium bins.114]